MFMNTAIVVASAVIFITAGLDYYAKRRAAIAKVNELRAQIESVREQRRVVNAERESIEIAIEGLYDDYANVCQARDEAADERDSMDDVLEELYALQDTERELMTTMDEVFSYLEELADGYTSDTKKWLLILAKEFLQMYRNVTIKPVE